MSPLFNLLLATVCLCCFHNLHFSTAAAPSPPIIDTIVRGFTIPYEANMPEQIVVDHYDNVYSLDFENNHVAMFDYNGTFIHSFTIDKPALYGPTGLAVDTQLNVYVADANNNRIVKWDANGTVVKIFSGHIYNGVAVDSEGFLYAFVYEEATVVRMDQNGTEVQRYNNATFGNRGGLSIDCDGNLLVADMDNARAFRINTQTGDVMNVWTTTSPPLNYPWNIAGDCDGNVYIADCFNGRMVRMDNDNNVVAIYNNRTGYGVAITSKGDVLTAPGGEYNVALMAPLKQDVTAVEAAVFSQ